VETRIEALECKLMDAEDQIETLNMTVFRQQERIDRLEHLVRELGQLVRSRPEERASSPADEIPPHY
jgi:SlyX protein